LNEIGFGVLLAEGIYFTTGVSAHLGLTGDDVASCCHITEKAGVAAFPVSAFYNQPGAPNVDARFAFSERS